MNIRRRFIKCPLCGTAAQSMMLVSGNTFDSTIWTDSKIIAPRFPHFPEIARCRNCQHFYWVYEAEEILTEIRDYKEYKKFSNEIEKVVELEEVDYFESLTQKVWRTQKQEKRLRILTLWKVNDRFRKSAQAREDSIPTIIKASESVRENLSFLDHLLDIDNRDEILLKAEVARELELFDTAVEILKICLEQYSDGQHVSWIKAAKYIQDLAKTNDNVVRVLPI
jgi:hypothetical protein